MVIEITDTNFSDKAMSSELLTIIDFWAEWCGPCRAMGPVFEQLSNEYAGRINIGKVNVDHQPKVSTQFGITAVPSIVFMKNGKVIDKLLGSQNKSYFIKKIESHINHQ